MKDLAELRMIAEEATPGPWFREYSDVVVREPDPRDVKFYDDPRNMRIVRGAEHLKPWDKQGIANAVHIATFDPPTVLELIDELETARQQRNEALVQVDKITQAWSSVVEYAEGLERRLSDAAWEANMDRQGGA